jgi:hypothetical protein
MLWWRSKREEQRFLERESSTASNEKVTNLTKTISSFSNW